MLTLHIFQRHKKILRSVRVITLVKLHTVFQLGAHLRNLFCQPLDEYQIQIAPTLADNFCIP